MDPFRVATAVALVACMAAVRASAQSYPVKALRIVVPYATESIADLLGRQIAASMSKDLAEQVVVDNRPGAQGAAGAGEVARAAPDGYTLLLGTATSQVIAPLMTPDPPFDPVRAFQPITLIATVPAVMVADKSIGATPAELVQYLKSNPGLSYATESAGTLAHLAGEWFAIKTGVQLVHVPYKSVFAAISDAMAGQLKLMIYPLPVIKPFIDSAAVRPIALISDKRIPSLAGVPTIGETLVPGFDFTSWWGVLAPAGTARPIVDRLHAVIVKAMDVPGTRKVLDNQGLDALGAGPDRFADSIQADYERWREVVQVAGLR